MSWHPRYPTLKKKGRKNIEYMPDAWLNYFRCRSSTFTTNGDSISSAGHVLGITNQCGQRMVFSCSKKGTTGRHVKGILSYVKEKNPEACIVLPFCPSCGEEPPESFLEEMRNKASEDKSPIKK